MPTIIITRGLPGCSKSTFAKEYRAMNTGYMRVNKDDIRTMLWGDKTLDMAVQYGYTYTIQDFMNVPLEVCLERVKKRGNGPSEEVICDMYATYHMYKNDIPNTL